MITQQDIIYFLLTDRFCDYDKSNNLNVDKDNINRYHGGDFAGIIKKIPYLKYLGITAIWITPVYLSIGSVGNSDGYHGYWALDFDKIDPHLYSVNKKKSEYSKEYLKNLCDMLHENNIKVILDIVVNHTGYHNDTYKNYQNKKIKDEWLNTEANRTDIVKSKLCGLPDINCANVDASDYLVNNVLDWIEETGIDGIVAVNTTSQRYNLSAKPKKIIEIGNGGLSGQPLKDRSTEMIRYIKQKTNGTLPIIGVGGIMSRKDALEKLDAGADLLQIFTGFVYEGPSIVKKIVED